jgi:hypothetical protein
MVSSAPVPTSAPPQAVIAAVLSFVAALPALLLAAVLATLTGLEGPSANQAWAAVPLAVVTGLVVGGVRLLRRRGSAVLIAANAPLALAGLLQSGVLLTSGTVGGGLPLVLLVVPGTAIVLALTTPVRRWLASGPRWARRSQPAPS